MQPTISILIPSLHNRLSTLFPLLRELEDQIMKRGGYGKEVELLIHLDGGNASIGAKRNSLLQRATGKYCIAVDDDDTVTSDYIPMILLAAYQDPDVICINGFMTTDGTRKSSWKMSIHNPWETTRDNKGNITYLRYPNHLAAIKSEIAKQFKFPEISFGEDTDWATQIKNSGLLKKEVRIEEEVYHYKYISHK